MDFKRKYMNKDPVPIQHLDVAHDKISQLVQEHIIKKYNC